MGGQGYDLGQVYGKITLDASGIADGINKARQSLASGFANMGNSIQSFGDQITGLGARMTALSAPFAAFSASGLNVASDFDALMKQIELFGGVTGAELEEVRQFTLKWGADTKFSAQDTGQAFLDLLKSGMDLEEAMTTLPDVLNLAAAGDMSLAQSAGIASGALAMFQMDTNNLAFDLNTLQENFGVTRDMFEEFALDGSFEAGMANMSQHMGITSQDWASYRLSLVGMRDSIDEVNPAIYRMIDAVGLSGESIAMLVENAGSINTALIEIPPNFIELQNQLGITDEMFTAWGQDSDDFDVQLDGMALALGTTTENLYKMWNATKPLTPEIEALAEQLGISQEDWEEYAKWLDESRVGIEEVNPAIVELINNTGLSGERIREMFIPQASASTRIVDALAQAANASRADIADLGQALNNVGPIANTFGMDVQETAAVLAVFSQNGIMGAEAGTQLKSMLLNLARPTKEVKAAYNELGVSLYDSSGNVKDFNTFLLELDASLDALPVQRQNELMQTLGGSYGILGLTALRASDGIGDMLAQMEASPEAGLLATEMMETFQGKVISLQGSIETLKIEAFTPFMNDVLKPFIDRMIVLVNNMAQWAKENPDLTKTLLQIGSAVVVAGPALVGMGFAINNIGFAIKAFAPVVGLLTSPLGLMAGAGLALAHVFDVDLRQAFEDILATARPVLESLREWFVTEGLPAINNFIQNTFLPTVHRIGEIIGQIWTTVAPILSQLFNWFVTQGLPAISNFIQKTFIPGVQRIGEIIGEVWEDVAPVLAELFTWFVEDALPAINEIIQEVFIPIIQDIGRRIGEVWSVVYPVLVQLYNWFVTTALPAISNFIQTVFIPAVQGIAHIFKEIYETVAPILQFLIEWFVTKAVPIIAGIINDVIIPAIGAFVNVLGAIWNAVAPALQTLIDWFQSTGWPIIEGIINNVITPVIEFFVGILKGIWELVEPVINELVNWFNNVIEPVITTASGFVTTAIDAFILIFTGIWTGIQDSLKSIENWFNTTIAPVIDEARTKFIQPAIDKVVDIFKSIWEWARPGLEQLVNGIRPIFDEIGRIINGVISELLKIPQYIKQAQEAIAIFNGNAEIVKKTQQAAIGSSMTDQQIYDLAHRQLADQLGGGFGGDLLARFIAPGIANQTVSERNKLAVEQFQNMVTGGQFANFVNIPSKDTGGIGLADMPYLIGKPQENNEIFVPRATGDFIPNFMEKMDALFERENMPSIGTVVIHANTEEGGRAAARGFVDEFERTLRSKG